MGEQVIIERRGTDGNMNRAVELLKALDGSVDAFGMGGIDLYLIAGDKRYIIKDALRMARAVQKTPILDGSGLKNTLERRVIGQLEAMGETLSGKRVLMVSAVDRFGMAEAMVKAGCQMTFGDLIFALGLPLPIHQLKTLRRVASLLLPVITRLPFTLVYPTGEKQDTVNPKYHRYYEEADIIAGDFLFIRKFMPSNLAGKMIITNTVTPRDQEELAQRKVATLVTTTPNLQGRSFGTNVMEALIVAFSGKKPEELREDDYHRLLDELRFRPHIVKF
jgi:hypothetical protein